MQTSDVQRIAAQLRKDSPDLTPAQFVQGVRTLVHGELQLEKPVPHALPAPTKGWKIDVQTGLSHKEASDLSHLSYFEASRAAQTDEERLAIHDDQKDHLAERRAEQGASVPKETHVAFQKWRATDEGRKHPWVSDALHFAHFNHGRALWVETDKLVADSGISNGGMSLSTEAVKS